MSDPYDPHQNPPGWTDPYADLSNLSGNEPLPPMEPPTTPPAQPPGSPLLTGLIIGLLLIALSVAVFQLLSPEDSGEAGDTTTTTLEGDTATTTLEGDTTTTTTGEGATTTTVPAADPFDAVPPAIEVDRLKMITNGLRVNLTEVPDIVFGQDAPTAMGRLVASFGEPTEDTGWQVSTGQYGVCAGDLERVLLFGPFAAIVTKPGGQEVFNGYRHDLTFGDLTNPAAGLETLSGLTVGASVADLQSTYAGELVTFSTDPRLGEIYEVRGSTSGSLLLWGPVEGPDDADRIIGIYAPDVCSR
ncbi:MAG: hypothetical protein R6W79_03385 [Acidimicrobiia bacterium]